MDEYSNLRFFSHFIKTIRRKDIKKFGIITDKDGTLLLNQELKAILEQLKTKDLGFNIHIIANSGRTISDMINCLEDENIPLNYFDYIIGDNGGMCLSVKNNQILFKSIMDKDVSKKVIDKFIELGGTPKNIRLANGENIFAHSSPEVKEYYKNSKGTVFTEDITDLSQYDDITKITLTGSHELIDNLNKYIRESIKGYKTHIGVTSFPVKSKNNYRLDFTRNSYKRFSF
ncbi:MAG: HAD hydrolase family protein [Clostridia bacterium]|nr:HAD hydrolase family protein [Clostridia bacterium]